MSSETRTGSKEQGSMAKIKRSINKSEEPDQLFFFKQKTPIRRTAFLKLFILLLFLLARQLLEQK